MGREVVESELLGGGWMIEPSSDRTKRARRRTVFRKIQVIHDDHSYEVTLRNLSKTGALIQGLADVPKGTQFVVDLGGGQLAVATVIRSSSDTQGLEFEQHLVDDGSGGLCTRHRVSPYALASAGQLQGDGRRPSGSATKRAAIRLCRQRRARGRLTSRIAAHLPWLSQQLQFSRMTLSACTSKRAVK